MIIDIDPDTRMYHDSFASMLHLQKQLEKAAVTQDVDSSTDNWRC